MHSDIRTARNHNGRRLARHNSRLLRIRLRRFEIPRCTWPCHHTLSQDGRLTSATRLDTRSQSDYLGLKGPEPGRCLPLFLSSMAYDPGLRNNYRWVKVAGPCVAGSEHHHAWQSAAEAAAAWRKRRVLSISLCLTATRRPDSRVSCSDKTHVGPRKLLHTWRALPAVASPLQVNRNASAILRHCREGFPRH